MVFVLVRGVLSILNPLLDMLSASIWQEDRVGSRDRPGAVGGLARVEVGPVVVVVDPVLVMIRMWLLLFKGAIQMQVFYCCIKEQ